MENYINPLALENKVLFDPLAFKKKLFFVLHFVHLRYDVNTPLYIGKTSTATPLHIADMNGIKVHTGNRKKKNFDRSDILSSPLDFVVLPLKGMYHYFDP